MTPDAIILFAHGSRDPLWRAPLEAVATAILAQQPQANVRCAYLELCEPDLPTVAAQMASAGAQRIRIVPMFLGMGKHAREDLPELVVALRAQHPSLAFDVTPAIGEDQRVTALLAQVALG
jgi:sirohydrochlorin cobaltochelatase